MRLQRGVIILPSAMTLANLFFGLWAVISASRGQFMMAAWLIVWAAVFDTVDGRVARYTQTGSRFGEELDSLVDAISFGVAPGLITYYLFLTDGTWGWVASFFYIACAVIRLARFNVEQAGHAKVVFHGLPSPSSGMTLATFYPFSQTDFFRTYLTEWRWPTIMIGLMIVLGFLMMSHVPYPVVPKFGFRTRRGFLNFLFIMTMTVLAITVPAIFFFPAAIAYVSYGLLKALFLGFFERLPEHDPLLDAEPDEAGAELRVIDYAEITPHRRFRIPGYRRRRRSGRRGRIERRQFEDKPPDQKPHEAS
ncbi:MAG: CDP-diacylglycerol--serine O-phosphatidyltransferase [Longimicrobiales bacterium]